MRFALFVVVLSAALSAGEDPSAIAQPTPSTPTAVFPIPTDRPPTLASLRRRFRGARVRRRISYGESDPGFPIHSFCVDLGARCGLEFFLTPDGRLHGLTVRTPTFVGPAGIRVGASYPELAAVMESDCIIGLGDDIGLFCDVVGHPNVRVVFTTPDLQGDLSHLSETPTPAQLAAARVVSFYWNAESL